MKTATERINDVYDYLLFQKFVHNKSEFAKHLGYQRSNITNAMNGRLNLPVDVWTKILSVYPETFNAEWLMTGNGEMLKKSDYESTEPLKTERHAEVSIVELAASLIKENEALRRDLVATINEVHRLRDEMSHDRDAIASIRSSLSAILYNSQTSRPIPMAAENEQ